MSYQVLARKFRPRTFAEVIGQGHVLKALVNALDTDRLHHAYLFTGTRGVGKTTLARVFAKSLNCEQGVTSTPCGSCSACEEIDAGRFVDLIEVDAASRTKVDETRELLDNVQYAPTRARYKVYLIDEVHMFSNHSFNALLKTLEEPPPHVKFLLATTDPKKLPVTILSRCLQFNLTRIGAARLAEHLAQVLDSEGVAYEPEALALIADAAAGSVRDALSLLDQAVAHGGGRVPREDVQSMLGTVDRGRVLGLLEVLVGGDGAALVAAARELAEYVPDYGQVLAEMLELLRRVAVVHALDEPGEVEADARVLALAGRMAADECQLFYQIALNARRDLYLSPNPEAGFEMSLLRMLAFRPATLADAPSQPAAAAAPGAAGGTTEPAAAPAAGQNTTGAAARAREPEREAASDPAPEPRPAVAAAVESGAAAAPAPEPPPAPAAAVDADALDWNRCIEELGLSGLPRELARNSAVRAFDGRRLELVVQPQYEKLAQRRHVDTLAAALGRLRGTDVVVEVQVEAGSTLATPSEQRSAEAARRQREAEAEIDGDPNVAVLRDRFGATVEDVSTR